MGIFATADLLLERAAQAQGNETQTAAFIFHTSLPPYRSWPLFLQRAPPSTHPSVAPLRSPLSTHTTLLTYYLTLSLSLHPRTNPDLNLNLT